MKLTARGVVATLSVCYVAMPLAYSQYPTGSVPVYYI